MKNTSITRTLLEAIKSWMKRNAGKPVPVFKVIAEGIEIDDSYVTRYTTFKKKAFSELESEGYALVYTNDLKTVAYVDGYKVPENVGEKIAGKILGINEPVNDDEDDGIPVETIKKTQKSISTIKSEKIEKPNTYIYINKSGISPRDAAGCADFVAGIVSLPENIKLDIKIQVKESES